MLPTPVTNNPPRNGFHHHHHGGSFGGAYPVYVPVPVVVDPGPVYQADPSQQDQADDEEIVPGPTVFERRTPADIAGATDASQGEVQDSTPPVADAVAAPAPPDPSAGSEPPQPQVSSVLIFRDGHELEIQNYAIVGETLYDFTPGHARKVPLSQLDVAATMKANEDRGVDFTLPASARSE
ncbi:MAG TPA: hypothetical protein VLC12_05745 [Terriglobales bacterium]|nr:hypothetical protein [Terriglobales bacterium]